MASLQEYLEGRTDDELRGMMQSYCRGQADIPVASVLLICHTLAQRDPELPDPYVLFLSLCRKYC